MIKILLVSLVSGLIAGSLNTGIQMIQVLPLIHQSEEFEGAPLVPYGPHAPMQKGQSHSHHHHLSPSLGAEIADSEPWAPDESQRLFFTWASNCLLAAGWALLISAVFLFIPRVSLRTGVLWGMFAYMSFFVAPSLGLSPELPGMAVADLQDRQIWWVLTTFSTGLGFCLVYFARSAFLKAASLPLFLMPHLHGAPQASFHGGSAPVALWKAYVSASYVSNFVFWLVLGLSVAFLFMRIKPGLIESDHA